jgi:hypothetical protein
MIRYRAFAIPKGHPRYTNLMDNLNLPEIDLRSVLFRLLVFDECRNILCNPPVKGQRLAT